MPLITNLKYSIEDNERRIQSIYRDVCVVFKGDKELLQDVTRLRDFGLQLAQFAPEYDVSPESPGNGFHSCLDFGILFLKYGCSKYHESPYILDDFKRIVKNLVNAIPAVKQIREATKNSHDMDTDTKLMITLFKQWQGSWESIKHFYSCVGTFDLGNIASTALIGSMTYLIWNYSPSCISGIRILTDEDYRRHALATIVFKNSPRRFQNSGMFSQGLRIYCEKIIPWWSMGSYPSVKIDIQVPRQQEFKICIDARKARSYILRNANLPETGSILCRLLKDSTIKNDILMINYHGGGFVLGNRYSNDASLRYLIKKVPRMAVVSVEYTLAPAKKYPTQLQECLDVYLFFSSRENESRIREMIGFIPKKIIISGDSAGGSLSSSIMVALSNIRRIEPSVNLPEAVFLFYPISSMYPSMRPSFLTNARSSLITPYGLLKMVPVYLPDVREMIDENQNSNSLKDSYRVAARQSEAAMRIPIISSIIDSLSWVFSLEDWTMKPYVWDDSEFQKILDATTISRCPMVSPIFFDDFQSLRDVSLYTYSCSFDGLLDDGVMISKKWKGKTKFTVMNNLQHGFLYVMFRKDTQKACDLIANDLKAVIECEGKFEHLSNNNV